MHFTTALFVAASATLAQAATIFVEVGANSQLAYNPSSITANPGDSIEFSFFPKNHSVVQSSFADPCHPLAGGFFSTFIPTTTESNETFTIVVNDTKPIWIYCAQTTGNHCQSGMVAAVNAPQTGNTLAAFAALAKNATTSTSPPNTVPLGGILAVKDEVIETVTTTVVSVVTTSTTENGSSFKTTYTTSYDTTYLTGVATPTTSGSSGSGSGSGSSGSSTTSSSKSNPTNAASGLTANAGLAGAVLLAGLAML